MTNLANLTCLTLSALESACRRNCTPRILAAVLSWKVRDSDVLYSVTFRDADGTLRDGKLRVFTPAHRVGLVFACEVSNAVR